MVLLRWSTSPQSSLASRQRMVQRVIQLGVRATILMLVLSFVLVPFDTSPAHAETNEITAINTAFGHEYAVPNGPRHIVEEAPGRIWYTSTEAGGIGLVEVVSAADDPVVRYRTEFYGFGEQSSPYDIVFDNGVIWFTLSGIRSIGRIDVATREIKTYALLTVGAAPTGLDIDPSGQLWIAQNNGHISRFDPTTETFTEFRLPDEYLGAPRIEDIVYQNAQNVWFTMPDANRIVTYNPIRDRFYSPSAPIDGLTPMYVSVDPDGRVWVTAAGADKIGRFTPSTALIWAWVDTPTANGGPTGLLTFKENNVLQIWITESRTGTISRLQINRNNDIANSETLGPGSPESSTWGIIRASDGNIWIADIGRNVLYELEPPYINRIYLSYIQNLQFLPE